MNISSTSSYQLLVQSRMPWWLGGAGGLLEVHAERAEGLLIQQNHSNFLKNKRKSFDTSFVARIAAPRPTPPVSRRQHPVWARQ